MNLENFIIKINNANKTISFILITIKTSQNYLLISIHWWLELKIIVSKRFLFLNVKIPFLLIIIASWKVLISWNFRLKKMDSLLLAKIITKWECCVLWLHHLKWVSLWKSYKAMQSNTLEEVLLNNKKSKSRKDRNLIIWFTNFRLLIIH